MILLALVGAVWAFSCFVEIRYVTDTPWTGPVASIERGIIYYSNWGKPPPGQADRWAPWDGDKGLSLRWGGFLAEAEPEIPVTTPTTPRMINLTGQPRVAQRVSLAIPFYVLLITYFLLARRPRPYPPGRCTECGYSLYGNSTGVCPECGERTPMATVRNIG